MPIFNFEITRRLIFRSPQLHAAFQRYSKTKEKDDLYSIGPTKAVYALHIIPHPHRVKEYENEYAIDFPEPTELSLAIEAIVQQYGWKQFLHGLKIFVRRRVKMMISVGYKRQPLLPVLEKIDSLKNAIK